MDCLDNDLFTFSNFLDVTILPGLKDPACEMLPQSPFFRFLFPRSKTRENIAFVENPYISGMDGIR